MIDILGRLKELAEPEYRDFMSNLSPTVSPESILGVRVPLIRKLAKELKGLPETRAFMGKLPHEFFEENQLHGILVAEIGDFDEAVSEIEKFLPYVDNWATCDSMRPKAFGKKTTDYERLKELCLKWCFSKETYTIRFGIEMFMNFYLDEKYDEQTAFKIATIRSEDYYVNMMKAWYFATAMSKQYDSAVKVLTKRMLDTWSHNKTIQKCVESRCLTDEQKDYLRTLRIKK